MLLRCAGPSAIVIVAISVFVIATAADAPPGADGLGFLESGSDYVIRFPEGENPFTYTASGVTSTTYVAEDGESTSGGPATWSMKVSLEVFRVARISAGSWVLLEHPSSPDDYTTWSSQRHARATLADRRAHAASEGSDEHEWLRELKKVVAADIATSETWVNLDHAVAISAVHPDAFEKPTDRRTGDDGERE